METAIGKQVAPGVAGNKSLGKVILNQQQTALSRIESTWKSANILRSPVDAAADFKIYTFPSALVQAHL